MNWYTPLKPAEIAEQRLVQAILNKTFPINSHLPAERELASQIGVTRPTLREALQRLSRDGWIEIHQGKPTRIRDYWKEGNLSVLSSIARYQSNIPNGFISHLLQIRILLSPTYTYLAVNNAPGAAATFLKTSPDHEQSARDFAEFDWRLHQLLTQLSGNPIFTLILNGFEELYEHKALIYFDSAESRKYSAEFYGYLLDAALKKDPDAAKEITSSVMQKSLEIWQTID